MLADRLKMDESALTDHFRWLAVIDPIAEEDFLADVSDTFTVVPPGLSLGSGHSPFQKSEPDQLERIATVGGLIAAIEQHLARYSGAR
jgi:hypothetical protein